MKLNEFAKLAARTNAELAPGLDNLHMVLGVVTEAGELADIFKKNLAYNKLIDWVNVQEEIGDCMWYLAVMCKINGFNFEKILDITIDKLKIRYPDKYTDYNANNRNLEEERKALEK
jgi:NTP pyrophosphatase (non-canonical NTP hydrolase)